MHEGYDFFVVWTRALEIMTYNECTEDFSAVEGVGIIHVLGTVCCFTECHCECLWFHLNWFKLVCLNMQVWV